MFPHEPPVKDYQNYQQPEGETGDSDSGLSASFCEQILGRPCRALRKKPKQHRGPRAHDTIWLSGNKFHETVRDPAPNPAPSPPPRRSSSAQTEFPRQDSDKGVQVIVERKSESIQVRDSTIITPKISPQGSVVSNIAPLKDSISRDPTPQTSSPTEETSGNSSSPIKDSSSQSHPSNYLSDPENFKSKQRSSTSLIRDIKPMTPKKTYTSNYTQTYETPRYSTGTTTTTMDKKSRRKCKRYACNCDRSYESDTEYIEEVTFPVENLRWEPYNSDPEDCTDSSTTEPNLELQYQYQDDYADLLEELETKLIIKNRERVRKTMCEFERRSRQNQNLEKPIFDDEEFEEKPINCRELLLRKDNKKTCACMCCRAKSQKKKNFTTCKDDAWVKPPPPPEPKFEHHKKNRHTQWAMNPRTGEWVKVGPTNIGNLAEPFLFNNEMSPRKNPNYRNIRCKNFGSQVFVPLTLKK